MRLDGQEESENVEDRRGGSGGGLVTGGGLGVVVLALIVWALGGDPIKFLSQAGGGGGGAPVKTAYHETPADRETVHFVKVVLGDTEKIWGEEFQRMGKRYEATKLILFTDRTSSGCGAADTQTGPFYCPADRCVYLDLAFFHELEGRFGAAGDFPRAYVIAHEVGHHVQDLLGTSGQVSAARRRSSEAQSNALSVRLELQADFLAGYWAQKAQAKFQFLDPGDVEAAVKAANAIGDDTLQKQARGYVVPDSFTHGTSDQRVKWFMKGFRAKDLSEGDTFRAGDL